MFDSLRGKKILIFGGTGFVGKNLCEYLADLNELRMLGVQVDVAARNLVEVVGGGRFIQVDITRPFEIREKYDYVIHAATPVVRTSSSSEQYFDVIVNGTVNILRSLKAMSCRRFLFISSGAVYSSAVKESGVYDESDFSLAKIYEADKGYASGKRIAELLVVAHLAGSREVEFNIARGFAFSGRHLAFDQQLAIGNFVRDALVNGEIVIQGDGRPVRSYLDASDLSEWLLSILLKAPNEQVYNVGSKKGISMKDLAEIVANQVGIGGKVLIKGKETKSAAPNTYIPSVEKIERELGVVQRTSLEESVQKMIADFRGAQAQTL